MRAVRVQYFLAYAVIGSLLPYIPVYLKQHELDPIQIVSILAAASVAVMFSPVLVTLLADARFDARRVMAGAFILSAATLLALNAMVGFWPILLMWSLHNLAYVSIQPLQDGINFSIQERRRASGLPAEPYHKVRVWGTIGFILPSLVMFGFLWAQWPMDIALWTGAAFAALGAVNTLWLPDPQLRTRPDPASALPAAAQLPTLSAARAMLSKPLLAFCLATFLANAAVAAYYAFYSIYLIDRVGIDRKWVGLAMNLGVVGEIFFMLGFGQLIAWLGLKRLMVLGMVCIALRLALLAATPNAFVAIGSQVFHGAMVLALQVAPAVFLNQHAQDHWRHSMQGLFTMLVSGLARILGNLASGPIARWSMTGVFGCAAGLTLVAAGLVLVAFSEAQVQTGREKTPAAPQPSSPAAAGR